MFTWIFTILVGSFSFFFCHLVFHLVSFHCVWKFSSTFLLVNTCWQNILSDLLLEKSSLLNFCRIFSLCSNLTSFSPFISSVLDHWVWCVCGHFFFFCPFFLYLFSLLPVFSNLIIMWCGFLCVHLVFIDLLESVGLLFSLNLGNFWVVLEF